VMAIMDLKTWEICSGSRQARVGLGCSRALFVTMPGLENSYICVCEREEGVLTELEML
jgi:hypothetical protein